MADHTETLSAADHFRVRQEIFTALCDADNVEKVVDAVLARLGRALAADKSFLFEYSEDGTALSETHEWCAEPSLATKPLLQKTHCPHCPLRQALDEGKIYFDAEDPALGMPLLAQMQKLGARAMLVSPLLDHGRVWGFVGFSDGNGPRPDWKENAEIQETLRSLARSLSGVFYMGRNLHRVEQLQTRLEQEIHVERRLCEDAMQASNAKTDFLSRMSHDMRTPMNGIMGMTALTRDIPNLPQQAKDNLAAIDDASHYLLQLINDTLDMQRIESGHVALHKEAVPTNELIEHIIATIAQTARAKDIMLVYSPINVQNDCISVDRTRIQQIFTNLISNAVKFTPEHGRIELRLAVLERTDTRIHACISVVDNGVGMSEAFIRHATEPFAQEPNAESMKYTGTGLGLSIVNNLVNLMGGQMTIESELGEGTTVTVDLECDRAAGCASTCGTPADTTFQALAGRHVLLCEDHPLNATITIRLLNKVGVRVDHAENGLIGTELMRRSEPGSYDAVLMDVRMPVMNGLIASSEIRKMNRADTKKIPIIAMTANALDADREKTQEAGMTAHLSKPVEPKLLYRTLAECIAAYRGAKA